MPTTGNSITDHTTTCPYCGHRVLHKNLNDHLKRIHPDKVSDNHFASSLAAKRTASDEWWDHARQMEDSESLSDVLDIVGNDPDPKYRKKRLSTTPQERCIICNKMYAKKNIITHYLQIHKAKFNPDNSSVIPLDPVNGFANIPKSYRFCYQCGLMIPILDYEKHQSKHIYNQPFRNEDEVHCPICKININHGNLRRHFAFKHPELNNKQKKEYLARVVNDEYYGFRETKPASTEWGTFMVSERGWTHCIYCGNIIMLKYAGHHIRKQHPEKASQSN
ncbi:MAG TPA: hypothetical protein PKW33_21355 [Anaerolineaceae bacterium]|nr:hypothetical protein [Anaerolineaceae bacterium]